MKRTGEGTRRRNTVTIPIAITDEHIERMAGVTGTKGRLLKALQEEKAKEHLNAPRDERRGNKINRVPVVVE